MKSPLINTENCTGCLTCINACPVSPPVISTREGKAYVSRPEECIQCIACVIACPLGLISIKNND